MFKSESTWPPVQSNLEKVLAYNEARRKEIEAKGAANCEPYLTDPDGDGPSPW